MGANEAPSRRFPSSAGYGACVSDEPRQAARHVLSAIFDDYEHPRELDAAELAEGQAYLTGVLVEMVAKESGATVAQVVARLRRLLGDDGDGTLDRAPLRPAGAPPSLDAEATLLNE